MEIGGTQLCLGVSGRVTIRIPTVIIPMFIIPTVGIMNVVCRYFSDRPMIPTILVGILKMSVGIMTAPFLACRYFENAYVL